MAGSIEKNNRQEESLDFLDALNVALSYLCWINADVLVVDNFLRKFPEALLLDGTTKESSSRHILEQRMRQCICHERQCNNNRRKLIETIEKGFSYYQDLHMKDIVSGGSNKAIEFNSTFLFPQLMATGRHLRGLSAEESAVRGQVAEIHAKMNAVQREVENAKIAITKHPFSRLRSVFSCAGKDLCVAHLERLTYENEMMILKYESAKKEQKLLIQAINQGHQNQYVMLKNALGNCHQHACGKWNPEHKMNSLLK